MQDKAYFLHRLKILEFNPPGQTFLDRTDSKDVEKRSKMHFILSYYGNWQGFYRLQSREQFEGFLSRQNTSENALRIRREYDIDDQGSPRHIKEFITDLVDSIEIRIVEERLRGTIGKISYEYFLPGFNIVEVWKAVGKEFYYLDFTRSEIQGEINILLSQGVLIQIGEVDSEIRYRFPEQLHLVLRKCWKLNDDLFFVMMRIFEYLRSPKDSEKKWLQFFYGGPIEQLLRDYRHDRSSKKAKEKEAVRNTFRESMPRIHKNFENLTDSRNSLTNIKYRLFVEKLLEYIYPAFMRRSFSSGIVV